MRVRSRLATLLVTGAAAAFSIHPASAQAPGTAIPVPNAGFEEGEPGAPPPRWGGTISADGAGDAARPYRVRSDADRPREGRASARLELAGASADPQQFGTLTNSIDATPYRGRRVRLTAAVRSAAPEADHVGLWLRVDREHGRRGFFDNMQDRPIRSAGWADYSIEGDVAPDAERLVFGALLVGAGRIWLDDVRLTEVGPARAPASPAGAASDYLDQAVELLRRHHINGAGADWGRIVADARAGIGGATEPADTHDAIRGMLRALGEAHSFLVPPAPQASGPAAAPEARRGPLMPHYALVDGRFGLVRVPAFIGSGEQAADYARTLRTGLTALDRGGVCGWIVDLRGNGGGNMWPMLNGLDPLLGAAPFGSFRPPVGAQIHWVRAEGDIRTGTPGRAEPPAFALRHASRPVAVLLDSRTLSSGEMTALALIGRAGVRTFGAPSGGFTTANSIHPLSDGARLVITTAYVRDRTGHEYRGPIAPDEPVAPAAAPAAALRWLAARPCAGAAAPSSRSVARRPLAP